MAMFVLDASVALAGLLGEAQAQAAETIIPSYLVRFRRTGQYEVQRSA